MSLFSHIMSFAHSLLNRNSLDEVEAAIGNLHDAVKGEIEIAVADVRAEVTALRNALAAQVAAPAPAPAPTPDPVPSNEAPVINLLNPTN